MVAEAAAVAEAGVVAEADPPVTFSDAACVIDPMSPFASSTMDSDHVPFAVRRRRWTG